MPWRGSQSHHRGGNTPGRGANHITGDGICSATVLAGDQPGGLSRPAQRPSRKTPAQHRRGQSRRGNGGDSNRCAKPSTAAQREGDPGRGGLQGTRPRTGQLGGPASRGLLLLLRPRPAQNIRRPPNQRLKTYAARQINGSRRSLVSFPSRCLSCTSLDECARTS
eukprot:9266113-Pyramimonas_sp.AAC.1